jgi:hypothetical protein
LRTGPTKATRKYRDVDVTVRSGSFQGEDLVLPAGAIARKLFHYIVTTANRHSSARVDLVSMNHLIKTIGVSKSAKTVKRIKAELLCLSRTTIEIDQYKEVEGIAAAYGGTERIVSRFSLNGVNQDGQMSLFGSWIELSPEFWERIKKHKFQPIMREAVWALSKPLAIDLYLWLQRRCQRKGMSKDGDLVTWENIRAQFGRDDTDLNKLKRDISSAAEAAAEKLIRFEWDSAPIVRITDEGLILRPIPRQAQTESQQQKESQAGLFSEEQSWAAPEPKRVLEARRQKRNK